MNSTSISNRGNVSILDSNLFGAIFKDDDMASIMGDTAYEACMVEAEVALARVEGRLGIIPPTAAAEIERTCTYDSIDRDKLRADTKLTGLPVWGLTRQLSLLAGSDGGRFVHWGLNTHDIMDIAQGLQMKRGLDLIQQQMNSVRTNLVNICVRYRETLMVARTHMQHALPTTFGYRAAIWLSAFDRHEIRLKELLPRVLMVQVGGASGSLASFGPAPENGVHAGIKVMEALAQDLGLYESPMPWHAARDGLAEIVSWLALVTGSLAKIALDVEFAPHLRLLTSDFLLQILLMSLPEIAEVAEPFVPHRGASSTMPQKANPVLCEAILASNRFTRQQVGLAYEALVADFERAGNSAWHTEWAFIPQSFTHCSAALNHAIELLSGLRVYPEAMIRNLGLSQGASTAEHLVVAISEAVGRARAHDVVYDCCREAIEKKVPLAEVAKRNSMITDVIPEDRIEWFTAPESYLGATMQFVDRVVSDRTLAQD